jgi:TIR domain
LRGAQRSMAADPIVYCLEQLTDYSQFERLCHELMALEGYPSIEPLGGCKDKGRDAIHVDQSGGKTTIFCYSVREDWRKKLDQDAATIKKHGHRCHRLVYLSTENYTPGDRDKAAKFIKQTYGWTLEPYGRERLRTLLADRHRHLIARHPHIFTPAFFVDPPGAGPPACDTLFLSYAPADVALATWLARRLIAEGYRVWCENLSLLGGEHRQQTIERLIQTRAFRVLALYSLASLDNADVNFQRALAHTIVGQRGGEFLVPLAAEPIPEDRLDWKTKTLSFIRFDQGWAEGLRQLLKKLAAVGCPRPVDDGRGVATSTLLRTDLVTSEPDCVLSNCLVVEKVPAAVLRFVTESDVPADTLKELQSRWAFHKVSPSRFLSFRHPPTADRIALGLAAKGGADHCYLPAVDGCLSANLIPELVRKSLVEKCVERGLRVSPEKGHLFFPPDLLQGDRLKFIRPDGAKSFVASTGKRKYWRPQKSEEYCYSLSPTFAVPQARDGPLVVLVRMRVYITDTDGKTLAKRQTVSRRKHLCKNWWNDDWLHRMLAVCQFLAEGGQAITIGDTADDEVVVRASPRGWEVPVGINERALEKVSTARDDALLPQVQDEAEDDGEGDDDDLDG